MSDFQKPLLNDFNQVDRVSRYAEFAPKYDDLMVKWEYSSPSQAAEYVQAYGSGQDDTVLDVGCGTGLVGKKLAEVGYKSIEGIDISADMLKYAQETNCYKKLLEQDLQCFPYPFDDESFSIVTAIGVLSTFENISPILKECCRLTQSGGYLIITLRKTPLISHGYESQLEQLEKEKVAKLVETSPFTKLLPKNEEHKEDESCFMIYQVL